MTILIVLSEKEIIYAELDLADEKPVKVPRRYEPVDYAIIDHLKTKKLKDSNQQQ